MTTLEPRTRGAYIDYCPTCGASSGSVCRTPSGRATSDHKTRAPECNGGPNCNAHRNEGCPS